MELEYKKECTINEELPSGYTLKVTIDQLCDEGDQPFDVTIGTSELGWIDIEDLNAIKKVFTKAINLYIG